MRVKTSMKTTMRKPKKIELTQIATLRKDGLGFALVTMRAM